MLDLGVVRMILDIYAIAQWHPCCFCIVMAICATAAQIGNINRKSPPKRKLHIRTGAQTHATIEI
jgi:hypothetical protein